MKALRYFFCVVLPPLAVLMTGQIASFFLSIILTLLGWIPGVGALYNAEYKKAAIHVGIFFLLSILRSIAGLPAIRFLPFREIFQFLTFIFFVYMAFDSYHTAKKRKLSGK